MNLTNARRGLALAICLSQAISVRGDDAWEPLNEEWLDVSTVVFDPTAEGVAYAGGERADAFFKTIDGGATWTQLNAGRPPVISAAHRNHSAILIDASAPQTLYVPLYTDGIYKSTDGGESWAPRNNGLPLHLNGSSIQHMAMDPSQPQTLYAAFAAFQQNGIYKSIDGGDSWLPMNEGVDPVWHPSVFVAIDPQRPQTVYSVPRPTSRTAEILRSEDGGGAWAPFASFPTNTLLSSLFVDPADSDHIILVTGPEILQTIDGGETWTTLLESSIGRHPSVEFHPTVPGLIVVSNGGHLATTTGTDLFLSRDSGTTWSRHATGLWLWLDTPDPRCESTRLCRLVSPWGVAFDPFRTNRAVLATSIGRFFSLELSEDVAFSGATDVLPPLRRDAPVTATLTSESPEARFFTRPPTPGTVLLIELDDPDPTSANSLYSRWDANATIGRFDRAATDPQPSQRLVIPSSRSESLHVLVRGDVIEGGANEVSLTVSELELGLESASASYSGKSGDGLINVSLLGGGFDQNTEFSLEPVEVEGEGAVEIIASQMTLISTARAQVVFELLGAPTGVYSYKARNTISDAEDRLHRAFEIVDSTIGPRLEVELTGAPVARLARASRLTLAYRNTGDLQMTAPLFLISGPAGSELALPREGTLRPDEILAIGIHPNGVPGKLPPGGEGEIPILLRSASCESSRCPERFRVFAFTPGENDPVGWEKLEPPAGIDAKLWLELSADLARDIGDTWREFHEAFALQATRYSRRGVQAASAREVFRRMARQALGLPNAAILGRALLAGTQVPVAGVDIVATEDDTVVSVARTDPDGSFALEGLAPGASYELALVNHTIVDSTTGSSAVTLPDESTGDLLAFELIAEASENELDATCEPCTEDSLPERPLFPPRALFTELAARVVLIVTSWDPNDKEGPRGDVDFEPGTIRPGDTIDYTVFFENLESAGAPAQRVVIEDVLPVEIDPETVVFRELAVGGRDEQVLSIDAIGRDRSAGFSDFLDASASRLKLSFEVLQSTPGQPEEKEIPVNVDVTFDKATRVIRWEFESLTEDPLAGFLLPNDPLKQGEARVSFTASPLDDLDDETEVVNEATITFDINEPISTGQTHAVFRRDVPPGVPSFPVPTDGRAGVEPDSLLQWVAVGGTEFDVRVWSSEEPRPELPQGAALAARFFRIPEGIDPSRRYSWEVTARNDFGQTQGPVWSFTLAGGPADTLFVRGDADQSGDYDIADGFLILRHLFGARPIDGCPKSADADDSGAIEITDALRVLNFVFLRDAPPSPVALCASDTTPDAIHCERFAPCDEEGG